MISSKVPNFRDAMTTPGGKPSGKPGVLFRSGKLSSATAADKAQLNILLAGGTIIDLRTTAVRLASPDPNLPGVAKTLRLPMSSGNYSGFVTYASRRRVIGTAIRTVAYAPGPVLIHCTHGRDRTGWVVVIIYFALKLAEVTARREYLKSSGATNGRLNAGLKAARKKYGTVGHYFRDALGLDPATLALLHTKLMGV